MKQILIPIIVNLAVLLFATANTTADDKARVDYTKQVAPLLRKYCAACHNADDREGKLALDSYEQLLEGGERGAVVNPGHGELSRLVRVLTGQEKPAMPPDDSERPKAEEIALLRRWIDQGAKGPLGGTPDPTILITPKIEPTVDLRRVINAVTVSPRGDILAVARYGVVELRSLKENKLLSKLSGHRGNVNGIAFSADGRKLVAAAGEAGLFGEARLWNVESAKLEKLFVGHGDSVYAARLSGDGRLLATAGYDRAIKLWDTESGKELQTLAGHNGAVFDVAFHPNNKILASASGDRTVKLWDVATGKRLDTLGQSLKELYTLAFHPSGRRLAAGGVDNRIRVWRISKTAAEGTNPLIYSRFAHEAAILRLGYTADGKTLASSGEDRLVKIWNAGPMQLRRTLPAQSEWVAGLALLPDNRELLVGRLDGTTGRYPLSAGAQAAVSLSRPLPHVPVTRVYDNQPSVAKLPKAAEREPNDDAQHATPLKVPGVATGVIHTNGKREPDVDLYQFEARAGEQWIIETNAARSKSPLDTKVEVLDDAGRPIERLLLRAVRDSEVTFRGINSQALDCRVVNWEEMKLNQLLYLGGEVVKLYRMPQGPDSGFKFYPGAGKRITYFDTTARAHALGEPCYIVVPYPAGSKFPDNGLPVFPVYFENDDEAAQKLGSDSRLTFTAPADGSYLVRVSDVRGFSGSNYKYELTVRRPQPGFTAKVTGMNPKVNAGSGKSFTVAIERIDNFNGPVRIDIDGLPPGFQVTSPLVIEVGHLRATGVISSLAGAAKPTAKNQSLSRITATAQIGDREIKQSAGGLGKIELVEKPKLIVHLEAMNQSETSDDSTDLPDPPEIEIAPGQTVTCKLRVERKGFDDAIKFEVENLPHGVIVDNIGLNGVLIPKGQSERTIYLTAADWVPPARREFIAIAKAAGNQASLPARLIARGSDEVADVGSSSD